MTENADRPLKVVVADDSQQLAEGCAEDLCEQQGIEAIPLFGKDFEKAISALSDRQRRFRVEGVVEEAADTQIDDADVFIIDFDLFELEDFPNLTAPSVAYSASVFTDVPVIGILNLSRRGDFDLSLRQRFDVGADFALSSEHVAYGGLWGGCREEFHPWHWPLVPQEVDMWHRRKELAESLLDESLLGWLSLPLDSIQEAALDHLGQSPEEIRTLTFSQWIEQSPCVLKGRDPEHLERHGDSVGVGFRARLAARALSRWLSMTLLPSQYPLCDLPHAYGRIPGIFKGRNYEEIRKQIARRDLSMEEIDELLIDEVREHVWHGVEWLTRPALDWSSLVASLEVIPDSRDQEAEDDASEWVFLEDQSRFGKAHEAAMFKADVGVSDDIRFIKRLPNIRYFPAHRIDD